MSTPPPPEYIKYTYFFMGAGGIGDSNSTNWKVMLAGNKIGKPHGTVRYGDDEAALYENDDSLAEKDMGKVLPEDAVSELHMLVKGIPTGLSTNVPAGPGCQATESIFYGNDEGGTTLGFDATRRSALRSWCEKNSLSMG